MMNKKPYLLFAFVLMTLTAGLRLSAQTNSPGAVKDYASHPYWIDMMNDPNGNFFETCKAFYAYWQGRDPGKSSGYKPFKRWEFYWKTRINPDGSFPEPGSVYREYNRYIAEHPVDGRLKTGTPVWVELGPKTRQDYGGYVGVGRINAIAFHPTDTATVYIGAPKGGFWITNDGGKTWNSHTDNMPTMGVSAILVHPDQPSRILIGTGDRDGGNSQGLGVFKSEDGGQTWAQFNQGMGYKTVGMFARSDKNLDLILAACNGGIYKTVDGGTNWTRTSPDESDFRDIKFRPGSETIAYATSGNGFYRSDDGGDSWTLMPDTIGYNKGGRLVIGVTPANDSLVYLVCGGNVFKGCFLSRNFGETFTTKSTTPNILGYPYEGNDEKSQAWYDLMIHIDPVNPRIVYVGGINIWKSGDEGTNWQITSHWWGDRTNEVHADQHAFAYNPLNNRIYAGNDGGIYYTADNAATWKEISEGLGIGQLYRIGVSNADGKKITAGFQDNGSATWTGTTWLNSGGGDGMECAVDPFDARYSYTTIYYGDIYRYLNNTYDRKVAGKDANGITEDGGWVTPFILSESSGNVMVVGFKNIWICKNVKSTGTLNWVKISNNLGGRNDVNMGILEQSSSDYNILYAVRDDGKFFRTDNLMSENVAWVDLTSRLPSGGSPSDLESSPYDPGTLYMTHNRKVYKSENKGASWTDISGSLPNININTIVFDKSSVEGLYIGTDAGIYFKDSDMEDWVLFGTAFPVSVGVTELEIYQDRRSRNDSKLRASTFGRGVWETRLAENNASLPPSILTANVVDETIELSWKAPYYEQDIQAYRLYRNDEFMTLVYGTSYTDFTVQTDITYTYRVSALYNGGKESSRSNEAMATIVTEIQLPYAQNFDRSTGGWFAKYSLEGWNYGTSDFLGVPGRDGKFFAANSSVAGQGVNVKDYLITPTIDLTSHTGKTITLKYAYTMRRFRTYDKLSVHYRVAPDSAWVKIQDLKPPSNIAWLWDTTQIDLPEKAFAAKTQIGFLYDNSNQFAWGAAIDDVELFHNTTSTGDLENPVAFRAYPNPTAGQLTVEFTAAPGKVRIELLDLLGRTVLEKNVDNPTGTLTEMIDLRTQAKGVYQLLLRSGTGEWKQKVTLQ